MSEQTSAVSTGSELEQGVLDAIKYAISHKATLSSPHFWVGTLSSISMVLAFFLHKQIDLSSNATMVAAIVGSVITAVSALAHAWKVVAAHQVLAAHVSARQFASHRE